MRTIKGKQTGILGTIIIHLIAGILFMSLQLNSLQKKIISNYEVELAPEPEPAIKKEKALEATSTTVEKVLKGDQEMLNIARNLSSKPAEKINAKDYIDKVKEELIKSGKLGADNFIDDQKKQSQSEGTENIAVRKDTTGEKIKTKPKPKMKGPTVCVSCVLPREPANETGNVFERKNALKRNVATRQPARFVGPFSRLKMPRIFMYLNRCQC